MLFYEPDREVLAEFMRDRIRPALVALDDGTITEQAEAISLKKRDSRARDPARRRRQDIGAHAA